MVKTKAKNWPEAQIIFHDPASSRFSVKGLLIGMESSSMASDSAHSQLKYDLNIC